MIAIRQADPGDATAMAELRWEFRSPRGPVAETREAFVRRCATWMRDELADDWRAWIALDDGRVVGQIWMKIIGKVPNPTAEREHHAYVSNMYVSPAVRGGLGDRLLTAALDAARRDRVDAVVLWPSDRSRSLYQRHGFVVSGRLMELTLSDDAKRS